MNPARDLGPRLVTACTGWGKVCTPNPNPHSNTWLTGIPLPPPPTRTTNTTTTLPCVLAAFVDSVPPNPSASSLPHYAGGVLAPWLVDLHCRSFRWCCHRRLALQRPPRQVRKTLPTVWKWVGRRDAMGGSSCFYLRHYIASPSSAVSSSSFLPSHLSSAMFGRIDQRRRGAGGTCGR
jgi:hypothetical protein